MQDTQSNAPLANSAYTISNAYAPTDPFITVFSNRDPINIQDVNYPIKKRWINFTAPATEWVLKNFTNVSGNTVANWIQLGTATPALFTLSDTGDVNIVHPSDSIAVPPNNIQFIGGAGITIVGNDTLHTMTITNTGTATNFNPDVGITPVSGATVNFSNTTILATNTLANGIRSNGTAADTISYQLQYAGSFAAAAGANRWGIAQFDANQFTVVNGFVQLIGAPTPPTLGLIPDDHTAPGTTPVIPDGSGNITLEGGALYATGTRNNPIRTNSLAANKMDFEIQEAGSDVFPGVANKYGVAQFDSSQFTVTNGFVQVTGSVPSSQTLTVDGFVAPAVTNVVAPSSNNITINGALVVAGTNPVQTISHNAAQFNVQVQTSQALAAQDSTKVGLCNFDDTQFTVSPQGFVQFTGSVPFNPNSVIQLSDDFINASFQGQSIGSGAAIPPNIMSVMCWSVARSPGWLMPINAFESGHPGILAFQSSGTSAYQNFLTSSYFQNSTSPVSTPSTILLGGGTITLNWVFKLAILSTNPINYTLRIGFGDTFQPIFSTTDQANGLYFEYSNNINGGNWVYKSANSSVRTTVNSVIPVTLGWHNAQISINAAASSVSFSVDGVSLGAAITTNIPTANPVSMMFNFIQNLGTVANNSFYIDLVYYNQTLTTPR